MNDTSASDLAHQRRVFELLRAALDHEEPGRAAWLAQQCGGDMQLLAQVSSLLDDNRPSLLDTDAASMATRFAQIDPRDAPLAPGTRIGNWVIERLLGHGGMGAVHLAQRSGDDFTQRGALKLIKRGMDSAAVLARFRRERQILSQLEHPHIARLLDGGISDDGQPYFVMEYVAGQGLREWLAGPQADLDARITLFLDLGDALAHAHQHLVVHCDIKPENLMVDANGHVRLLDFGIARLLEDGDDAALTMTRNRFVSRAYAAPEQIAGAATTTATDIYQLGALLFELLTGVRHDPSRANGAVSSRLMRAWQDADANTRARVPAAQLRGDPSIIISRATDPEPARRYATVQALCADVRAWRAGMPISARADSAIYRLRRFVGRHRLTCSAGAVAVLAIIAGSATALWQAREAEREARLARSAQSFLVSVFESSAPDAAAGHEVTARELLDHGNQRIANELADQPRLRGEMQLTLGKLYAQLGQYAQAARLLGDARSTLTGLAPSAAIEATLELSAVERELDHLDQAEQLLAAIAAPVEPALHARSLVERAQLRERQGRFDEALADARSALTIDLQRGDAARAEQARDRQIEALLLTRQARFDDATKAFEHALADARAVHGPGDTRVALMLNDYGGALAMKGRASQAEAALRQALQIRRERLGKEHPAVAETLQVLASVLRSQGRIDEARACLDEAIGIQRKVFGNQHNLLANSLNSRGLIEFSRHQPAQAEPFLQEAVAIYRKLGQSDTPPAATTANVLAAILMQLGRYDEAAPLIDHALAVHLKMVGEQHPLVMSDLNSMAQLQFRRGQLDRALEVSARATAIVDAGHAPPREGAYVRLAYANLLARAGRPADALREIDRSIDALTTLSANEARLPAARAVRADALLGLGRIDEALATAQSALAQQTQAQSDDPTGQVVSHVLLARIAAARHDASGERRERALARALVAKMPAPEPLLRRELERR